MLQIDCDLCAYFVDQGLLMRDRVHDWVAAERDRRKAEEDEAIDEHRRAMGAV